MRGWNRHTFDSPEKFAWIRYLVHHQWIKESTHEDILDIAVEHPPRKTSSITMWFIQGRLQRNSELKSLIACLLGIVGSENKSCWSLLEFEGCLEFMFTYQSFPLIRLIEKILHHQKHLKSRPSCSPFNIGKQKMSPKQRSWMAEILHRRTKLQNTTLKRGCRVQVIVYCQICPRQCRISSINSMI